MGRYRKDGSIYPSQTKEAQRKRTRRIRGIEPRQFRVADDGSRINWLRVNTKLIREYKRKHPCVDCSETRLRLLQFDHVDPATKFGCISNMRSKPTNELFAEIEKCVVRCIVCHGRRTARQGLAGELQNTGAKLSDAEIISMHALRRAGFKIVTLASFFGVAENYAQRVLKGKEREHLRLVS